MLLKLSSIRDTPIISSFKNTYYISDIDRGGAFWKGEALWKKEISVRLEIEIWVYLFILLKHLKSQKLELRPFTGIVLESAVLEQIVDLFFF